ncbi:hypothetical protein [Thermotalea metallivorans]|uniref:Uncharacterized protein n=1 Tax=Thermotalea metallivorans TaxID=520762 RepID=A0A140LBH7_9FIRM|nr:hypothetical protein [Thermotalea metallivorans]KXG77902.1 hypothetical protein AN619_03570 [Thermotalea metallivorans]
MEEKQLIEIIEKFIMLCDELLRNGSISQEQYAEFTNNKKEFLKSIA